MFSAFPSSSSSGWLAGDQLPRNMLLECLAWTAGGHSRLVLQEDTYEIRHLAITRPAKTLGTKWVTDLFGSLWREHTQASRLSPLKCFFSRTMQDPMDGYGRWLWETSVSWILPCLKSSDESLVGLLHLMDGNTLDDKNAVYIMGI